jgi:uncharacterized protein (TIGR02145 family)
MNTIGKISFFIALVFPLQFYAQTNSVGTIRQSQGIEIDGTMWANSNVDKWGTFAASPYEKFKECCYWSEQSSPCPDGWRLPVKNEWTALMAHDMSIDSLLLDEGQWLMVLSIKSGRTDSSALLLPLPGNRKKYSAIDPGYTAYWSPEHDLVNTAIVALALIINMRQSNKPEVMWEATYVGGCLRYVKKQ